MVSQVTITDPTHPLSGRTFPLLQTGGSISGAFVLIGLPGGEHRRVPRNATDLAERVDPSCAPHVPLNPVSVRTLLPLLPVVRRLLGATEESLNENDLPTRTARVGLDPDTARAGADATNTGTVVGARSTAATPIGPVSGRAAASHPSARPTYVKRGPR